MGESGTGKTASLRNLNPSNVLLIQALRKSLPFKSSPWETIVTDQSPAIIKAMRTTEKPIIIIDDFQYCMANEFMRRATEKGYEKFTEIGQSAWRTLNAATELGQGKRVYILNHVATTDEGTRRMKTIGKMLDDKITPEGMVTIVLRTSVVNGRYVFFTHNSGADTVKSPMGMFSEDEVDNDLKAVDDAVVSYYQIA